ncbi:MAG: NAD(P)/FAD-dependent oxidoreductase [Christensenellales bacterium]
MKNYVIIGGGVASVGCIEGIRSVDKTGQITLISQENYPVYCRPLISYLLQGKTDLEKMKYRPDEFYEENNCRLLYTTADSIETQNKIIKTDKATLPYDELCIATGSAPFVPPFEGLDSVDKKFGFMTLDDALALQKAIDADSKVLIVGAGLIGLKCAEGIAQSVAKITVCDLADRILSSILDDECAALMQKPLEEKGVEFLLGDSVKKFEQNKAVMSSGKVVDFDVLVLAVGVRPKTALAKDAGIEVDRGIVTDKSMKTSLSHVYAAGDCAQGYDSSIDGNRVLAILPSAYMQGFCAGVNMAGKQSTYDKDMPVNAIGFFGTHALTAGRYTGEMYEEKTQNSLKRLFIDDNRLVGFMLIGEVAGAGIYTSLIREKTPLDTIDVGLMKKSPCLAVFDKENRRKKLGGML